MSVKRDIFLKVPNVLKEVMLLYWGVNNIRRNPMIVMSVRMV